MGEADENAMLERKNDGFRSLPPLPTVREGVSLEERTSDTVVPKRLKLLHAARTYDTRVQYRESNRNDRRHH